MNNPIFFHITDIESNECNLKDENSNIFNYKLILESINNMNSMNLTNYQWMLDNMKYFQEKNSYLTIEEFYSKTYIVKDLYIICDYYNILKDVKYNKSRKAEIISAIIYFESQPNNLELVEKRNRLWGFMKEIQEDEKLKKFILM
jgi:hypothetical protein